MKEKTIHEGRNMKRIREILGVKQDALAIELGMSQQAVSALEQRQVLGDELLEKLAHVLKVPVDAIKQFNEEAAINLITLAACYSENAAGPSKTSEFMLLAKYIEQVEEIRILYKSLLKEKDDKIEHLQKLLKENSQTWLISEPAPAYSFRN